MQSDLKINCNLNKTGISKYWAYFFNPRVKSIFKLRVNMVTKSSLSSITNYRNYFATIENFFSSLAFVHHIMLQNATYNFSLKNIFAFPFAEYYAVFPKN